MKQVKSMFASPLRCLGWVLLLALPLMVVTSCSKDDEEGNLDPTGKYVGALYSSADGFAAPVATLMELTVEAKSGDEYIIKTTIDVSGLSEGAIGVLDVECPVTIVKEGDGYKVSGQTSVSVSVPIMGSIPLPVQLSGIIKSATPDIGQDIVSTTGLSVVMAEIDIAPQYGTILPDLGTFKFKGAKSPVQ
ncbi:MAG: hypothetical protein LBC40_08385 [Dysgonamonadaceae bacterium]|nr:hypothetical protein [Dysgonamonadaceae bacterium]